MPSIVFMDVCKGTRRKPAIANRIRSVQNCGVACEKVTHAVQASTQVPGEAGGLTEQECGEVTGEAGADRVLATTPEEAPREAPVEVLSEVLPEVLPKVLPEPLVSESSAPASEKAGCTIS